MQTSVWGYRAALFSALGLSPVVSCGGSTNETEVTPPEKTPSGFLAPPREPGYACTLAPTAPVSNGCTVDATCSDKPNGTCDVFQGEYSGCFCEYGCIQDSDCDTGQICVCGERYGRCTQATCTIDSDCKDGALCLSHDPSPGCNGRAFACQSVNDQCASDQDCPTTTYCSVVDGARKCANPGCAIGRPFLVGGAARVAKVVRRADWCSDLSPSMDGLDHSARATLAEAWTQVALMEHASIAAFSRFALELLSLGAPSALVEATHAAIRDETVHARDAFALASAYGGAPVGPGPFGATTASLAGRSGEDIVLTAILEGCVGETVAAAEATEALSRATDRAVREALTKVAADEARHATLAWRFIQWVIESGPEELARAAREALRAVTVPEAATATARIPMHRERQAPALSAHGMLDEATRGEVRLRVLIDVVAPCARALRRETVALAPLSRSRADLLGVRAGTV
jgi:hypothetical protein